MSIKSKFLELNVNANKSTLEDLGSNIGIKIVTKTKYLIIIIAFLFCNK